MTFTPKTWVNDAVGATPITAPELNRLELGVDQAYGRSANVLANATTNVATVLASWDLPANTVAVTDMIQVRAFGQVSGTSTLLFRLHFGPLGTTVDPTLVTFATSAAGVANGHWQVSGLVATLTSTTATGTGQAMLVNAVLGPVTAAFAAATVNLTVANKLSLAVTMGTAGQTCTTRAASIGWIG